MAIQDNTKDWADRLAPDANTLQAIALEAYAILPENLRALTKTTLIRVAEYPDEDIADDLGLESPYDILGIFEGQGISGHWTPASKNQPNKVTLFRRAILDYWCENEEALHDIITHVLINELGHHFGFSEHQINKMVNDLD